MLKNYFKTAWRNLVKNRFYSVINISTIRPLYMSKAIVRSALEIFPVRDIFWYTLRELMLHEAFYTT